jgi:hypothetical protein
MNKIQIVQDSGNVFADLGLENPRPAQPKPVLTPTELSKSNCISASL